MYNQTLKIRLVARSIIKWIEIIPILGGNNIFLNCLEKLHIRCSILRSVVLYRIPMIELVTPIGYNNENILSLKKSIYLLMLQEIDCISMHNYLHNPTRLSSLQCWSLGGETYFEYAKVTGNIEYRWPCLDLSVAPCSHS